MGPGELDASLFFLVNRGLQNSVFDSIMPLVTSRGMLLCLPFLAWAALRERGTILPYILLSVIAVGLADGSGNLLKHLVGRVRPCSALEGVNLLVGCGKSFSFPSNHASNAFAFALTFIPLRRGVLSGGLLFIAALVAFSRIYVGVHYPGDVLGGMLLGGAAAWSARFIYHRALLLYRERSYANGLYLVLIVLSLLRAYYILTGPFELVPDEAHYWEWSRRLDWSYYSKGPLIAYVIRAGTLLFGNNEFGVRFFAMVFSAFGSILIFRLGRAMYDERTGFIAAVLVQIVPIYGVFGLFMTIDSPFIFFWILSLFLFRKAFQAETLPEENRSPLLSWALLGLSIGLGMLAKHMMALFYLSGVLFMFFDADARRLLRRKGPYISLAIGLLVFSPVLFWNYSHDWVMFRHTAGQAHLNDGLRISPRFFAEYLGSQIGVVTPVLFVMMAVSLWKLRKDPKGAFLFWFSAPTFIFFALKSIQGKVQGNWAVAAYATGFIAFAFYYLRSGRVISGKEKHLLRAAFITAAVVTLAAHFPQHYPIPPEKHPMRKFTGNREFGKEASRVYRELASEGPLFVFTDTYQRAGLMAFYMEGNPATYCLNIRSRMNQYDLWPGFDKLAGYNAVFAGRDDTEGVEIWSEYLGKAFERCEPLEITVTRLGRKVQYKVFKCYHFNGLKPQLQERYW